MCASQPQRNSALTFSSVSGVAGPKPREPAIRANSAPVRLHAAHSVGWCPNRVWLVSARKSPYPSSANGGVCRPAVYWLGDTAAVSVKGVAGLRPVTVMTALAGSVVSAAACTTWLSGWPVTGSTAVAALMSPAMPAASIAAVSSGLAVRTSGSPLIAVVSVAPAGMGRGDGRRGGLGGQAALGVGLGARSHGAGEGERGRGIHGGERDHVPAARGLHDAADRQPGERVDLDVGADGGRDVGGQRGGVRVARPRDVRDRRLVDGGDQRVSRRDGRAVIVAWQRRGNGRRRRVAARRGRGEAARQGERRAGVRPR